MLKTTFPSRLALLLVVLTGLQTTGAGAQGLVASPPVSVFPARLGTQLLWTSTGLECIAGCDGILQPIRLGSGTEWQVSVDNFDFTPQVLDINLGDSVTWTNSGGTHNVRADDDSFRCANGCDGQGGNGDPASNAWVVTLTFLDPATIPYYCEEHGAPRGIGMSGVINVIDALIFEDGFESGDTGEWSTTVP